VGIAALSGPVDPERLAAGVEALRRLGFEPVLADNLASRHGFFAGTDQERLAGFHRLAADPDLPAILFARGGHGLLRLLPGIDWDLLRRHPRAYVGYSDLTPLLLCITERLKLVTFHGPLVAADLARGLTAVEEASLLGALAGSYPAAQPYRRLLREAEDGLAFGPLMGGCLSLLAGVLGTPYIPDLEGALLFWEDINEPPYKIDRMLTQLYLSGSLADIEGMIVGHLGWTEVPAGEAAAPTDWAGVVRESVAGCDWPLVWGLDSGHFRPNRTLPLGLGARLDAAMGEIVFEG
jgi:muramoyltetrapeptide carboxypeptidase